MAGTSESSNYPEISQQNAELEEGFDPNTMRKTKPGVKRLALTLSVLFSFLLGLFTSFYDLVLVLLCLL